VFLGIILEWAVAIALWVQIAFLLIISHLISSYLLQLLGPLEKLHKRRNG
jgi:hypothetical protein